MKPTFLMVKFTSCFFNLYVVLLLVNMALDSSFNAYTENWKRSLRKTRGLTGLLRNELYASSDLYDELLFYSVELFKKRRQFFYRNGKSIMLEFFC